MTMLAMLTMAMLEFVLVVFVLMVFMIKAESERKSGNSKEAVGFGIIRTIPVWIKRRRFRVFVGVALGRQRIQQPGSGVSIKARPTAVRPVDSSVGLWGRTARILN